MAWKWAPAATRRRGSWLKAVGAAGGVVALVLGLTVAVASANAAAPQATAAPTVVSTASTACSAGTTVHTSGGRVCGSTTAGVTSYLGIRYAAPPVGRLRWQPPHPAQPRAGTFRATTPGNFCPAIESSGFVGSEDCLNLNVQIPAGTKPWQRLPVMVEIHGGGFVHTSNTSTAAGLPDGSHLVQSGHVVYVAMNYRIGILGFMANTALGPHSGDYGLQDQQAALRWIQANITRFGGNPRNVTIFGESAGGASVCDAVASPTARGLFQHGNSESGFYNYLDNTLWPPSDCKSQLPTERQAQQAGAQFAAKVGCGATANQLACLRNLSAQTLVDNAGRKEDPSAGGTVGPTINGTTLPMSPGRAFATGHVNKVSLAIGVDRDEFNGGPLDAPLIAATPAQYRALVRQQFGRLAPTVERLYPLSRFPAPSPFIAYRTIMADSASVCPALQAFNQVSRYLPTYAWEGDNADAPRNTTWPTGAYHTMISGFLFPAPGTTLNANQQAFAGQVAAQWTGYARTGNPTVNGTPLWTRYTPHNRQVMSLVPAGDSALVPAGTLAAQHNCAFWDAATWPIPRH